jgi:hypothetical protein
VDAPTAGYRLQQRLLATTGHRDLRSTGRVEHLQRVRDNLIDGDVPGNAGNRADVDRRVPHGKEDRQRIVHPGVDIQDHIHDADGSPQS